MEKVEEHLAEFRAQDRRILISHSLSEVITELRNLNLLNEVAFFRCLNLKCKRRGKEIGWVNDNKRIDLGYFRCWNCRKKRNLKDFSIFEDVRQMLCVYYRAIFICFLDNELSREATTYCYTTSDCIRSIYQFCRSQISRHIINERENSQICLLENYDEDGEEQPECEIDESLFTHLRGQGTVTERQVWIIGVIERKTRQIRCLPVLERNSQTIRQFITQYIANDQIRPTRIYSDGAPFYQQITGLGYEHCTIVHERGFGSGEETTNHVESLWSQLKRIGNFNVGWNFSTLDEVEAALNEVIWRWMAQRQQDKGYQELADILSNSFFETREKIIDHN